MASPASGPQAPARGASSPAARTPSRPGRLAQALLAACLFAAALLPGAAGAGEPLRDRVAVLATAHGIVGLAFALVEDGRVTAVETFGTTSPGGDPVTPDTPFRAGSISKNVTALLAADLAARGQVDLDAPVARYAPDLPLANPWGEPVTLAQLLEHTAGLPGSSYRGYADAGDDLSPAEALARHAPIRLRWQPGRYFSYANLGHTVAAAVMERAAGDDFDSLVEARVLRPLGMAGGFRWSGGAAAELSPSFDAGGRPAGFWRMDVRPSGALMASIADLAALTRFHATGGESAPVASPALAARMRTPGTGLAAAQGYGLTHGLGMFGFLEAGRVFWGHWGRVDGFQASFGVLPEHRRGFAVIANTGERRGFAAIRAEIGAALTADLPPVPLPPPAVGVTLPAGATGWWVPFSDDMALRGWISGLLGLTAISLRDGVPAVATPPLVGAPQPLVPVAEGFFRTAASPVATHVFLADGDGLTLLGDGQLFYRRLGGGEAAAVLGLLAAAVLALVVPPAGLAVAGARRAAGRPAPTLAVWAALALATAMFAALQVVHVRWGMLAPLGIVGTLGEPGTRSLALAALSLGWPAAAAAAALLLRSRWHAAGAATRISALATLLAFANLAVFLAGESWLPLLTWR